MVRLQTATLARLRAFRESLMPQVEAGRLDLPPSGVYGGGPPTDDTIVNRLLDQVEAHRERARQQQRKKKGPAAAAATEQAHEGQA